MPIARTLRPNFAYIAFALAVALPLRTSVSSATSAFAFALSPPSLFLSPHTCPDSPPPSRKLLSQPSTNPSRRIQHTTAQNRAQKEDHERTHLDHRTSRRLNRHRRLQEHTTAARSNYQRRHIAERHRPERRRRRQPRPHPLQRRGHTSSRQQRLLRAAAAVPKLLAESTRPHRSGLRRRQQLLRPGPAVRHRPELQL